MDTRQVIGCMTGTSLDAIDCALVQVAGSGLMARFEVLDFISESLGDLSAHLRMLAEQEAHPVRDAATCARELALAHARLLAPWCAERAIDFVCVHGQTVWHRPPVSWQLMNLPVLAHELGVAVVGDLRAADLAAGGQGAPITPLADFLLFEQQDEPRTVVNLGGFCNITRLPGDGDSAAVRGADICACNHVLDAVARRCFDRPYDHNGEQAAAGSIDHAAYAALAELLLMQREDHRSLGTADELVSWVETWQQRIPGRDCARSACAALAETIAGSVGGSSRVLLAGGGVRNRTLVAEITARCRAPVELTDAYGVAGEQREAVAMAVLGTLCADRVPITLPAVTGVARAPVAGVWVRP